LLYLRHVKCGHPAPYGQPDQKWSGFLFVGEDTVPYLWDVNYSPQRPNLGAPLLYIILGIAITIFLMASCAPRSYPVTPSAVKSENVQKKQLSRQFRGQ